MATAPKPRLTEAEYLELEEKADRKSDFYYGEMIPSGAELTAMAGGIVRHSLIAQNVGGALFNALRGTGCAAFNGDLKVRVNEAVHFYPDVTVACREDLDATVATAPVAVFEVLSPSTERFDRGEKFQLYQQIASLREYVLVRTDAPVVERFVRAEGGKWIYELVSGLEGRLTLTGPEAVLELADIFRDVTFPERATHSQSAP